MFFKKKILLDALIDARRIEWILSGIINEVVGHVYIDVNVT